MIMPETKRCPMCGKPNPADAEVCQYCQAQLKPIVGDAKTPETPAPKDEMDWLRELASSEESQPTNEIPEEPEPAALEDDSFLLNRLRSSSNIEDEAPKEADAAPFSVPDDSEEEGNADWLHILEESSTRKESADHDLPAEEKPDLDKWLETLDKDNEQPLSADTQETDETIKKKPRRKITDRLKKEEHEPETETNDWLNTLREEPDQAAPEPMEAADSPAPFTSPATDENEALPDWLNSETPFSGDLKAADTDLPDWLTEEKPEEAPAAPGEPVQASQPAQTDQPAQKSDLPDWLQDMAPDSAAAAAPEAGAGQEVMPSWLQDETSDAAGAGLDSPMFGDSDSDDLADLLSGFHQEEKPAEEMPTEGLSADPFTNAVSAEVSDSPFKGEDLPDWIKFQEDETPAEGETPATEAEPLSASPFMENEQSEPAIAGETASETYAHPFAADNLPDWLETEEASEILPEQAAKEETADLAPAQLPGWLAAMRPVEAVAPESLGSLDERIEKSGPLAGLRGVLPADKQTIKYRKPPVYSVKLKMTETQAAHAGMLEELLKNENKPSSAKRESAQGSKRLMQLVVALVLIVVLIIFRGAGLVDTPSRPYLSPFVTPFYDQIESLAAGSPVLLAVDYDPGYTGELKAASSTVIQRLMQKQQRIAVISTVPAGPALAEDLLQQAYYSQQMIGSGYTLNTHTISLGYLPGGVTSLKEFALRPKQAARYGLTVTHDGLIPWDHPALEGVNRLTDFTAVIVITDSVDTGRGWVEQVQPALGSTPMLLISSAQAAPMLEPYVQSGQLSGMLSGLAGSVSYENILQQPGIGQSYWIAFQGGIAVVIALILVGILLELFVILFTSRRTQSEA